MRIAIDLQGAQTESRFRGIGRYSLSLAQAIVRNAGTHEVWLIANAQLPESIPFLRESFQGLLPQERLRIFDAPIGSDPNNWTSLASELIREDFISSLAPDVVLVTSIFESPPAVTSIGALAGASKTAAILYDLIPLLNQTQYLSTPEHRTQYFRKLDWLKNAALLLAISESSRQEGLKYLELPTDRIVNISTAVGLDFQPNILTPSAIEGLRKRLGISRNVVMYAPGGFDHRKNFARLIEAYSGLSSDLRSQHQLVIVGRLPSAQRQELVSLRQRFHLGVDELLLTDYVEDNDLIALYSLARVFVFPSLHEGFGLPVLEAMTCGAIVIGSNCTSIPEVIGLDTALFDPMSVHAIREKLFQALTDESFREQLRLHSQEQATRFTWDSSAVRAIAALECLHAKNQRNKSLEPQPRTLISALAALEQSTRSNDRSLRSAAHCIAFNRGPTRPQFFLDISSLVRSDAKSGIQRVVRSLLSEFLTNPPPGYDVLPIYFDQNVYRNATQFTSLLTGLPNTILDTPVNFCQDDVYLSLDLTMHLTRQIHGLHADLASRGIKLYFIIYDILLLQHPEWWPGGTAEQFNLWLTRISEVANGLICISRAVANEVKEWLVTHPPSRVDKGPEIGSFHLGADVSNSMPSRGLPPSSGPVLEQIRARTSFLMVSTIEPRKGYAQTLAAFDLLWAQGHDINLVIVGKRGWLVEELINRLATHPEQNHRLFWLEGISDEYLELVYQSAKCLVAASEGEGFGLPLIEGAQHKLPIIARDIPVFREVAGDHAYYFDTSSPVHLAQSIQKWLDLYSINQHPKSEAMPWLTWEQSATQLLTAIGIQSSKTHQ